MRCGKQVSFFVHLRGKAENQHGIHIKKRHRRHDHHGHHAGVAINIDSQGDSQHCRAGPGRGLGKSAHLPLILHNKPCRRPDSQKHHRGAQKTVQTEARIKFTVKIHTRNGAEQTDGQGAAEHILVGGLIKGIIQEMYLLKEKTQCDHQKHRNRGVQSKNEIFH